MKRILSFLIGILLMGYAIGCMLSCSDDEKELVTSAAIGIRLDKTELELMELESDTLLATILPDGLKSLSVVWSSNADSIATVNDFGIVTAVKEGTAVITASTFGRPFSAECQVTVTKRPVGIRYLELDTASVILTCYSGEWETLQLTATVQPANADADLLWTSTNEAVATVTEEGLVQAVAEGTAFIRCVASNDESRRDSCEVRVVRENGVIGVSISPADEEFTLKVDEVKTLSVEILPQNAEDKTVTWTSSNPSVLVVEAQGDTQTTQLTALKEGEAVVTLKSNDGGFVDSCKVVVISNVVKVTSLTGLQQSLSGEVGGTAEVSVTVAPSDASNKTVIWTSSDEEVVAVQADSDSRTATVTYLKAGTATITATSEDNPQATLSCSVTVLPERGSIVAVTHLSGLAKTLSGIVGETSTVSVNVFPSDATNTAITWTSSDETVATVEPHYDSRNAKVTYLKAGTTTITATSVDNPEAAMSCTVTVNEEGSGEFIQVTRVSGNAGSSITYSMGITFTPVFNATVLPYDATDPSLTWTSSDESVVVVTPRTNTLLADLKLLKPGTTTITATSVSNPNAAWVCVVTVTE